MTTPTTPPAGTPTPAPPSSGNHPTTPGPTQAAATSPGPTNPAPTTPGPTQAAATSPGPTAPGPTQAAATSPGPTNPARSPAGATPAPAAGVAVRATTSAPSSGRGLTRGMMEAWLRSQGFADADLQANDVRHTLDAMFASGAPTEARFGLLMRDINNYWMFGAGHQGPLPTVTAAEIVRWANPPVNPVGPTVMGTPGAAHNATAAPAAPTAPMPATPAMGNPNPALPASMTSGAAASGSGFTPRTGRPSSGIGFGSRLALFLGALLVIVLLVFGIRWAYGERTTVANWFTPSPTPAATEEPAESDPAEPTAPAKPKKQADPAKKSESATVARTLECRRTVKGTVECDVPDDCSVGYSDEDERKLTLTCNDEEFISRKTIKEMPLGAHGKVEMVALK